MVYELVAKVHVNDDVHFTKSLDELGSWFKKSFEGDSYLEKMHGERGYKGYVFSNLFHGEKDGVYKRGHVYTWRVRAVSEELLIRMHRALKRTRGGTFTFLSGHVTTFSLTRNGVIEKLKTVNPIVMNGLGMVPDEFDVLGVKRAIEGNIEKKYRKFVGGEIRGHEFISRINVVSRNPLGIKYKDITFLGFQYEIYVKEDALSQAYAELALATGLGEKNSAVGTGYVNAWMY